jgi:hypothetical protein
MTKKPRNAKISPKKTAIHIKHYPCHIYILLILNNIYYIVEYVVE